MRQHAPHAPVLLLALCLAGGCAAGSNGQRPAEPRSADGFIARPAAALAWSPPGALDVESSELDAILARDGRGEAALLGFDLPTIQTLYVVVDDRQDRRWWGHGAHGWSDEYERRAISTRTFVRRR